MTSSDGYNATIIQRIEVAPGLIILRVATDGPLFGFEAGQYTLLGLYPGEPRVAGSEDESLVPKPGRLIRRAYSIASTSVVGEYLEFYLTLVYSGSLTPRLFALRIGSRLHVGGRAKGLFTLGRVPGDRHVLLAGTGTGLAPYMSMLRSEVDCTGPRRFVVVHGARYSWDLGYRTELTALSRLCPNVAYLPVVSRPAEDRTWRGRTGYVQSVLFSGDVEQATGLPLSPESFHVFLCGNPDMVDAARAALVSRGFTPDAPPKPGNVHAEEYW
ncbi:MAG TPA: ferredoxin--NADP reductase [Candidatus Saccharimonadales bacterium]|nr:ferredoxin--NADP reductase [Candidatus Saccharimonadales bacterium]